MFVRVVIVQFEPHVTPKQVLEFKGWLEELAAHMRTRKVLMRMTCGAHHIISADEVFDKSGPDGTIGDFMSIWEFPDEDSLSAFLLSPFHREMAAGKFKTFVRRRFVANIPGVLLERPQA